MGKPLTFTQEYDGSLTVEKSVAQATLRLIVLIGFMTLWYIFLLNKIPIDITRWTTWIPYGFPLLATPSFYSAFKVVIFGEKYNFNRAADEIVKNGKRIAQCSDVERVQIRVQHRRESSDTYVVSIILRDGKRIAIESLKTRGAADEAADAIADALCVSVVVKT
ncbi:MAG: hypothetical protein ACOZB3_05085 [Calditrichota bacterium]